MTVGPARIALVGVHLVHASAPFLGVGDPILNANSGGRNIRLEDLFDAEYPETVHPETKEVHSEVEKLPARPETAEELRAIARLMGATEDDLLLGDFVSPLKRQSKNASAAIASCAKEKDFHNRTSSLTTQATRRSVTW
jgi:hypothetical protein